jgi:hypothetical protein
MTETALPFIGNRQMNAEPAKRFLSPVEVTNPVLSGRMLMPTPKPAKRHNDQSNNAK